MPAKPRFRPIMALAWIERISLNQRRAQNKLTYIVHGTSIMWSNRLDRTYASRTYILFLHVVPGHDRISRPHGIGHIPNEQQMTRSVSRQRCCVHSSDRVWVEAGFLPLQTALAPAAEKLLRIIRCSCMTDCSTLWCMCKKHNIVTDVICRLPRRWRCVNRWIVPMCL